MYLSKPVIQNQILRLLVSNTVLEGKKARISLAKPFDLFLKNPDCTKWSGRRDWLDFFCKNLRRCVGYALRHWHTPVCLSLLVEPALRVFISDCLQSTNTKKPPQMGGFLCLWSGIWHVLKESPGSELPWSEYANSQPAWYF